MASGLKMIIVAPFDIQEIEFPILRIVIIGIHSKYSKAKFALRIED
jgi:hypothetical protein